MTRRLSITLSVFLGLALLGLAPSPASAEPTATAKGEIEHLLKYVSKSDVLFIRNGDSHKASDAAEHIKAKYDYYLKKISTAEDFVRLSATKSALSGKAYQVKLTDGTTEATADWLIKELTSYRETKDKVAVKQGAEESE